MAILDGDAAAMLSGSKLSAESIHAPTSPRIVEKAAMMRPVWFFRNCDRR
jgi:hypothetical protein